MDRRLKMEVFIIGWEKELLTKTGLIIKKKAMREYVWQEGQWCPGDLTRSQKRRVQRLRNKELDQAQASGKLQVWRTKQTADRKQPSANIQMAFLLPSEFKVNGESQQLIQAVGFKILS